MSNGPAPAPRPEGARDEETGGGGWGAFQGVVNYFTGAKEPQGVGANAIPTSGIWGSSFNLLNTIVGDGVVAIPWAMDQSGLIAGVIVVCFVGILTDITVNMIVESGVRHGNLSYEGAVEHVLGKRGRTICMWAIAATAYGAMISYVVIVGDTVGTIVSGDTTQGERAIIIFISSLVAILPLCLLRDMASLESTSTVSIGCNVIVAILVVVLAPKSARDQGIDDTINVSFLNIRTLPRGLAVVAFAFVCHHASFAVRNSLSNPTPPRWRKVTHISVSSGFVITALLGIGAYISFGDAIEEDVLNSFANDDLGANFARAFLATTMMFTFPMEHFVARQVVYTLVFSSRNAESGGGPQRSLLTENEEARMDRSTRSIGSEDSRDSSSSSSSGLDVSRQANNYLKEGVGGAGSIEAEMSYMPQNYLVGITLALWGSATAIAMATNRLGFVLSLTGSVGASIVGFILPPLVYFKTFQDDLSFPAKVGTGLIFLFGVVMLVLGTIVTFISEFGE